MRLLPSATVSPETVSRIIFDRVCRIVLRLDYDWSAVRRSYQDVWMQPGAPDNYASVLVPHCATRQHASESASKRTVRCRFGMSRLSSDSHFSYGWQPYSR